MSFSNNFPTTGPSLELDFANVNALDPRITFTRSSIATVTNSLGLIQTVQANVPRFDYDPVTLAARGLLIEEQRTNLLTYSEQFDNVSAWGRDSSTINANATTAPDGTTTADKVVSTNVTAQIGVNGSFTATVATYTASFSVKQAEVRYVQILWSGGTSTSYANFDLLTGTVTASSGGTATITAQANGFYRIALASALTTAGGFGVFLWMIPNGTAGRAATYTGNGTDGFFVWGAQLEAGAFPTSYIPTVASTVTRNADAAVMTGTAFSSWFNANQGTLYTEGGGLNAASSARLASITDNTFSNRIINYFATSGLAAGLITTSGVSQANPVVSITSATALNKVIQGYALNNVNIAANGTLGTLDTSATIPAVTLMRIGVDEVGTGSFLNGIIRKIAYYPVRLTDAQLQALTL